jgi:hypothetical protein
LGLVSISTSAISKSLARVPTSQQHPLFLLRSQ